MATSGKKQKKNKWKPIDPTLIINTSALPVKPVSWSEDVEAEEREQLYTSSRPAQNIVLPSAPRASIDADVYERMVPHEGPYVAFLSNLAFDIADEDIYEFFQELKVARVDLLRDDRGSGRCKGLAFVEFDDRNSLITALGYIDAEIKERRVRINLPNAADERQNRGGNSERRQYRDRNQDRERGGEEPGDWRSAPRTEVEERRRPYGGRDSYNRDDRQRSPRRSEAPATMTRDDFGTAKPTPLPERSRGGFTDRSDRGGGGGGGRAFDRSEMKDPSLAGPASSPERERERGGDRYSRDTGRSFDRSEMRSSQAPSPERERERGGDRYSRDTGRSFDRTEMRERPKDLSPPSEPKTRPKLNLAPRTKPIEVPPPLPQPPLDEEPLPSEEPTPPAHPKPSAASIFGGAKPVDTAAREREIEEKLKAKSDNDEKLAQPNRSRGASPHSTSSKDKDYEAPPSPSPPENVWTKRSQQMTNSNITNGTTSPDSAVTANTPAEEESDRKEHDDGCPTSATETENDENRHPNSRLQENAPAGTDADSTRKGDDDEDDFELSKDRRRRGGGNESSGGGWRDGGGVPRREGGGGPPPRRNLEERNNRDFSGRDNRDSRDNRGFRNSDDRSKRPFNRDSRDNRDTRGPARDMQRDSQGPRRNVDNDRPPRSRDDRGADESRDIRRNPNNTRENRVQGDEGKRVGDRPGAPASQPPPSPAPTPTTDPAKPKVNKKSKAPIDDIAKMPKVQESKMPNFAQGNKFSLLPDEEDDGEDI